MTVKEQVIKIINNLPESVTTDQIMEELYFKMQVDQGLKELDEGKGIDHDIVKEKVSKWPKK